MPTQRMTTAPDFRRKLAPYFSGEEYAYGITLLAILSYYYGTEFLEWEPQTIRLQVTDDIGEISDKVMDKLMAAVLALTDDAVFDDAVVFNNVATALSDIDVVADEWDEPEVDEISWAITEIFLIRGELDEDMPISPEVAKYAGVVLGNEGFFKKPHALDWAEVDDSRVDSLSDDPVMFNSIFEEQDAKVAAVNQLVKEHTTKAIQQVQSLPFGADWLDLSQLTPD